MEIAIRAFKPEDQAVVQQLVLDGLGDHFPVVDPARNPDLNDIWASYPAAGHVFCVVEEASQIIGAGALIIADTIGQLARVSVARAHRRRGIGRAIVRHLLAQAALRGIERVWMETNDDWHEAIALYAGCDFVEFDRRNGCVFMSCDLRSHELMDIDKITGQPADAAC
jgi:ribosomal protein S18 acetylase RimI-like enzyme